MKLYTLLILILPFTGLTQVKWERTEPSAFMDAIIMFEKTIAENESYSYDTQYTYYRDYFDSIPVKTFQGRLISKGGKEMNVHQLEFLMIQNGELNLTIDTIQKKLIVQFSDSSFFYRKSVKDYAVLSELASAVYKKSIDGNITYLLELKEGLPYHAMEFVFSGNDRISEITIYSNTPYESDESNSTESDSKAKIVLRFSNFQKGKIVNLKNFVFISDCVSIDNKTLEIKPLNRYTNYEIIDLRN